MAVKYQTFLCKQPQDLLLVTLNHIDTMRTFVEDSKQVAEQVDYTYHLLHTVSYVFDCSQYYQKRYDAEKYHVNFMSCVM
jgi:hypothetical protein